MLDIKEKLINEKIFNVDLNIQNIEIQEKSIKYQILNDKNENEKITAKLENGNI